MGHTVVTTTLPDIILLNGASSSGKSSLARALLRQLPSPYCHYSSDILVDGGFLPALHRDSDHSPWSWSVNRPVFFRGFHHSIAAFAHTGSRLVVDHVIEYQEWFDELASLLAGLSVYYVGVHCDPLDLARREAQRPNRSPGEAISHLREGVHTWSRYDLEVSTSELNPTEAALAVVRGIEASVPSTWVFSGLHRAHPDA